ncbi:MAG: cupredoxin domain-containing protein [Actinobacteria bacterium]|nr:cupredoxin domain-containing protein [Actinomycetota bacterium]
MQNTSTGSFRHDWVSTDGGFATELLNAGEKVTVTLEKAGTFDDVCTIHKDVMKGTITVEG